MKNFCTNCGRSLKTNSEYCPSCGKKIVKVSIPQQSHQSYSQQIVKKKSHKRVIAVIAIIWLVVGSGATFYFSSNQSTVQDVTAKVVSHSKITSKKSNKLSVSALSDKQENAAVIVYASMKYSDKNWQRLLKNGWSHRLEVVNNHPEVMIDAENNRNGYTDYTIQPNRNYRIASFRSTLGETDLYKIVEYINDHNYADLVNQLSKNIVLRSADDD